MSNAPTPTPTLVLDRVLALLRPLVRLLLRHGVTYPVFAAALKRVFLAAAQDELAGRGMAGTDSAVSLLSGVHRRDVRTLTRGALAEPATAPPPPRTPPPRSGRWPSPTIPRRPGLRPPL